MNTTRNSGVPASTDTPNALTILREVSHAYEQLRVLRRHAAGIASKDHTYQALADAMGTTRSAAHQLVNRDAA